MTQTNTGTMTSRRLKAAERRDRAFRLRLAGYSFEAIGRALGCSQVAAFGMVRKRLDDINDSTALSVIELREVENARLDSLLAAIWGTATGNDETDLKDKLAAQDRAIKISETRMRLNGFGAAKGGVIGDESTFDEAAGVSPGAVLASLLSRARPEELEGIRQIFLTIRARDAGRPEAIESGRNDRAGDEGAEPV